MDTLLFDYSIYTGRTIHIRIMKEDGKLVEKFQPIIVINPHSLEAEDIKEIILKHKRKYKKFNLEYNNYIIFTH